MTRRVAMILSGLSLLGTMLAVFGEEARLQPPQVSTTKHVSFAPGGMIRINGSYGDLNVEGWDQPEVEVTVIKSMPHDYKPKRQDDAIKHLNGVQIVTERKSPTELTISTTLASRHGEWVPPLPRTTTGGVRAQYEIHVPHDSRLAIHHGTGSVSVSGVTGDIEASAGRGDIVLWLPPGSYSIDAKTKLGNVSSEFEGAALSQYLVGQRFTHVNPPPSHRLYLRMGFGGITIKGILPETEAPAAASVQ
jgi:hypothetical protein